YATTDYSLKREPGDAGRIGYGSYEDTINALERAITPGPWVLGDAFSAADVYIGAQLQWGMMVKTIDPRPAFVEYAGRIAQRPAAQRYREQTQKLMAQGPTTAAS
ncbi:MAG TPA: glutathione S-transferase C-terminal domain-containing protein, partial [Kofleriaceae bacterium]|nr:glutathione S-transferase C-terminal domain-containing protein [Kofleriaceae bacterium]